MRPPVPVSAPGKGATPDGKLCVSAVKMMSQVRSENANGDGLPIVVGTMVRIGYPRMALELVFEGDGAVVGVGL